MPNSPRDDAEVVADSEKVVREARRNTSRERLAEEFGEHRIEDLPNGEFRLRLKGKRELDRFDEMDRDRKRADARRGERAAERDSATHVTVRDARGNRIQVPERHAEMIDRMNHYRRTGKH